MTAVLILLSLVGTGGTSSGGAGAASFALKSCSTGLWAEKTLQRQGSPSK